MKQPEQNKLEIALLKQRNNNTDKRLEHIEKQVSNHIPTALREIRDLINKSNGDNDKKIQVLKDFVNDSNKEQDNKISTMKEKQNERDAKQNKEQWMLIGKVSIIITIVMSIIMSVINKLI